MEKYKNIEEDIENVTNKEVIRKNCISGIAIGLLIGAVLATVGGLSFNDPNSSMSTFLFTTATLLFLAGIVKFFVSRSFFLFRPTKSRLRPVTLYFDVHESDALQACFEMKRFEDLKRLKREKDAGVKLEAMIAHDQKFAAVQISEYIPYTYEAVTPVMCYYGEDARNLLTHFQTKS